MTAGFTRARSTADERPRDHEVLLQPWSGPHGGVPPFDRVSIADFAPALERAMAEQLAEVDRIAGQSAPPTFENTLAALERSGRALDRVHAVYGVFSSTMSSPDLRDVERAMAPRLAAFQDRITQNVALFARIAAVYDAADREHLDPEQRRLAWKYHTDFVRAGARLDAAAKARLSAINQRLATLYTTFTQNVLTDEDEQALVLRDEADLAGLPESLRAAAAAAAAARGHPGAWVIANTRSAMDPFLTYAERRDLREQAWRLFVDRGEAGATDNAPVLREILVLRAERARLLGYETHAHWRLENSMARSPARAMELMEAVWPRAVARVRAEVADMQAVADRDGAGITIEPWDYRYYAERVRSEAYQLDAAEVRPYLQLEQLRDAMFWVAHQLFGLRFEEVHDVPVYHPDVRVWRVLDEGTARHVGLWYFDP
ncbi:MAG TPA: M3 family metallopeptidase, partial [Gemmatimonadaceae bacterium]|nr:M3 family metallopeptidase [Gemmatimonadaceae bacterium]